MYFGQKQKSWVMQDLHEGTKWAAAKKRSAEKGLAGKVLAGAAFLFLLGVATAALFPIAPGSAATVDVEVELDVEPTIEMALDKTSLTLYDSTQCETGDTAEQCAAKGVLPSSSGTQVSANLNVYVTTNAAGGYSLSAYTLDPTNEMKHINTSVTADIDPTAGQLSTLAVNTWGMKYGAGDWMAVGVDENHQTIINNNGGRTSGICTDILNKTGVNAYESCVTAGTAEKNVVTFGANITDSLPSGRYTNDVVFSAVAKVNGSVGGN